MSPDVLPASPRRPLLRALGCLIGAALTACGTTVTVSPTATIATPSAAVAPSASPSVEPRQVVLTVQDLGPGYTANSAQTGPDQAGAEYKSAFAGTSSTDFLSIVSIAYAFHSPGAAAIALPAAVAALAREPQAKLVTIPADSKFGNGLTVYTFHDQVDQIAITWTEGPVLFDLDVGLGTQTQAKTVIALALAHLMDDRAVAAGGATN